MYLSVVPALPRALNLCECVKQRDRRIDTSHVGFDLRQQHGTDGNDWLKPDVCERAGSCLSQEISMHKDGKQVVETAVEARGGLLGRPVLLVLSLAAFNVALQPTKTECAVGFAGIGTAGLPQRSIPRTGGARPWRRSKSKLREYGVLLLRSPSTKSRRSSRYVTQCAGRPLVTGPSRMGFART